VQTQEELWSRKPGHRGYARYARELRMRGSLELAQKVLSEGLQRWPKDVSAQLLQAELAAEAGDTGLQKASLEAAAEMDPRSPAVLWGLASLLANRQYFQQARTWLERYVALMPAHMQAHELLATVNAAIQAEGLRSPTSAVAAPLNESPADLIEGTFASMPASGKFAPVTASEAASVPAAPRPFASDDDVFATMEMPSFHDQASTPSRTASADSQLDNGTADLGLAGSGIDLGFGTSLGVPEKRESSPFPNIAGLGIERGDDPFGNGLTGWGDKASSDAAAVSGLDIASRLEDLFKEEPSATAPMMEAVAEPPQDKLPELAETTVSSVADVVDEAPAEAVAVPEPVSGKVTGSDIADRLDDLFPTSSVPETSLTPPPSAVEVPPSDVVRGDDVDARLEELFGSDDVPLLGDDLEKPSFPAEVDFEATIQLPTMRGSAVDPEVTLPPPGVPAPADAVATSGTIELDDLDLESVSDTRYELRVQDSDDLDQLVDQTPTGRETTAEAMPVMKDTGSTMDLPALQEPDSWQPGSMLASRSSDVDSQLDELFASSSFPKEHFPPVVAPPAPAPAPSFQDEAAATTSYARADVTGSDIQDRLDDLFGTDSAFPSDVPSTAPSAGNFAGVPTVTLAEEYFRQGHKQQAEAVYRELLKLEPGNVSYRKRLTQIEASAES